MTAEAPQVGQGQSPMSKSTKLFGGSRRSEPALRKCSAVRVRSGSSPAAQGRGGGRFDRPQGPQTHLGAYLRERGAGR